MAPGQKLSAERRPRCCGLGLPARPTPFGAAPPPRARARRSPRHTARRTVKDEPERGPSRARDEPDPVAGGVDCAGSVRGQRALTRERTIADSSHAIVRHKTML